jgi:all-trans-8'-apo-beta-carotenal 15,15'-oxygenase
MLYRVGADGRLESPQAHGLERFSFVHDFAVSRKWYCFLLPQADFAIHQAMFGFKTAVGSLQIATERPMQALLLPREPDSSRPLMLTGPPGFVFHIAQAFDMGDDALALDVIRYGRYPEFDDFTELFRNPPAGSVPRLERLVLDPTKRLCKRLSLGIEAESHAFELPISAPAALGTPKRILYGVGAPPERKAPYLTAIQRLDTETGTFITRDFGLDLVGEPMWVPDRGGAEGWLLSLVMRADQGRTELVVLRASDLALQATVPLPHLIPIGFHGCWVPRSELTRPQIGPA